MKVKYDKEANAAYIQLSSKKPDGAIEMAEGVILHTTSKNEIVAIEILDATKKFPIKTLYKLELSPVAAWSGEGKKNPRVDLAVVILDEAKETPINLLAVIELKHYDIHYNSIGANKDMDHLEALRKGIYYPYSDSPTKLRARKAYFLYLVDEGKISFNASLRRKIERLKENRYLKVFLGYGDKGEFVTQQWGCTEIVDEGAYKSKKFQIPGETFRVLKEKEEREYGEYRTRRLVLEAWDNYWGNA